MKKLLMILILLSTGCAAIVIGGAAAVGTYTYVSGQLVSAYNANLETTYRAAIAGCESLNLPIYNHEFNLSTASITTKDGDKDVWISIKAQTSTTTEVAVRVGYLGDEFASKRIHDAIASKL